MYAGYYRKINFKYLKVFVEVFLQCLTEMFDYRSISGGATWWAKTESTDLNSSTISDERGKRLGFEVFEKMPLGYCIVRDEDVCQKYTKSME